MTVTSAINTMDEGGATQFHVSIFLNQTSISTTDYAKHGVAADTVVIAVDGHVIISSSLGNLIFFFERNVE